MFRLLRAVLRAGPLIDVLEPCPRRMCFAARGLKFPDLRGEKSRSPFCLDPRHPYIKGLLLAYRSLSASLWPIAGPFVSCSFAPERVWTAERAHMPRASLTRLQEEEPGMGPFYMLQGKRAPRSLLQETDLGRFICDLYRRAQGKADGPPPAAGISFDRAAIARASASSVRPEGEGDRTPAGMRPCEMGSRAAF